MESRASRFNPNSHSDVPLYNIQAVAAATGVPSITLRSWERRYGIPEPKRDPKGYRLYSDRDIAVTRWLRERVQEGVGISRAVNMLRAIEQGDLGPPPSETFDFASLQSRLLHACTTFDDDEVSRVLAEALTVASVEDAALNLLQPVLYEIGERWSRGELTPTAEHISSNLIRSQLAQLVRISPDPLREERILVGCAPGESHDIGALMLTLFLRRRGFDVIYAGASVEPESLIADVGQMQPAAVCLSAARSESAEALAEVYRRLTPSYPGVLAFGGQAFNHDGALLQAMEGIYLGSDARAATRMLEESLRT